MKRIISVILAIFLITMQLLTVNAEGYICDEMTEYAIKNFQYSIPSSWTSDMSNDLIYYHYEKKPIFGMNSGYINVQLIETGMQKATFSEAEYSEFAKGMFSGKETPITLEELQGHQFCTFSGVLEKVNIIVGLLNDNGIIYMIAYANPKETEVEVRHKFEELKSTIRIGKRISSAEYLFRGIPWLSTVEDVKQSLRNLTSNIATEEFNVTSWSNACMYEDQSIINALPVFELTYSEREPYQVAGMDVSSVSLDFIPSLNKPYYSTHDYSDYQFILARYQFAEDTALSYSKVFEILSDKLISLYGEPSDTDSQNLYTVLGNINSESLIWYGAANTKIVLHHAKGTVSGKASESVGLTYSFIDYSHIKAVSELEMDIDKDNVNGL